jgi:hypothetical protein
LNGADVSRARKNLAGKVGEGAIFTAQVHSHPEVVKVIMPKHIDLAVPLGVFHDYTNGKILPRYSQQSFPSLADDRTEGSEQLGDAVPVCRAAFSTAVALAFMFHQI